MKLLLNWVNFCNKMLYVNLLKRKIIEFDKITFFTCIQAIKKKGKENWQIMNEGSEEYVV